MNGAIADPCANTIKAPSSAMISRMGASQNFLRTRRKASNSFRNDKIEFHSEGIVPRTHVAANCSSCNYIYSWHNHCLVELLKTDVSFLGDRGPAVDA